MGGHRPPGETISVSRWLLPVGRGKATKTDAGARVVPLFPELRPLLLAWKLRKPFHRSRRLRDRHRLSWTSAAAERTAGVREGEAGGRA